MRPTAALLLLATSLALAACGDGDPAAPAARKRSFAYSHIAGLAPDSGYACPPRHEGAVARIIATGEGVELFANGDVWLNVSIGTWERWPSTTQVGSASTYNEVGRYAREGDTLTFANFDYSPYVIAATALQRGDSLALRVKAECPTDETIPGELTLIYKEILP